MLSIGSGQSSCLRQHASVCGVHLGSLGNPELLQEPHVLGVIEAAALALGVANE